MMMMMMMLFSFVLKEAAIQGHKSAVRFKSKNISIFSYFSNE
jgi:hypothetical protein